MGNIANSRLSSNFIACCRHIRLIDCPNDSRWYHCSLVQWPWFETLLHLLERFCLCPIDPAAADIEWYSWQIQVFLSQIFTVFHYPYTQALQPQAAPPQHLPSTSPAPPQHISSTSLSLQKLDSQEWSTSASAMKCISFKCDSAAAAQLQTEHGGAWQLWWQETQKKITRRKSQQEKVRET